MSYNFEESCLVKKQISGDLLKGISKGRIKLGDTVVEKLERIQSGSYSAMPIDRILELARDHKIDSELRNEEDKKNLEENKKIIKIQQKERDQLGLTDLGKLLVLEKQEMSEVSREFSEKNKDKKLHVFLIKKSRMEMDGWGEELSNDIDHFIYIANDSKIKLKKELKKSTEFERDRYDGELELIKKGKNSFTFTVENDEEPWEEYTYTLVGQKELDLPILMEPLGESQRFLMDIKSLILDSSRVIEKDITDSQKNLLFFDPSALAKEVSKNLKDLKSHQFDILMDEIKKVLGFFPTK
jgi:hypothetical protein